uniref:Ig-like domain-containing protein n=1 Tax=Anopheles epiroticus TaxID=199890 RepID=A0A182PUX7_9DIPT
WKKVTPSTLTLKNVDYDASGSYYCEVSTDTPIFTKASNDEILNVMLPQKGPPTIEFAKKQLYYGDLLIANCTTSRARPSPHITWLINGKQVRDINTWP